MDSQAVQVEENGTPLTFRALDSALAQIVYAVDKAIRVSKPDFCSAYVLHCVLLWVVTNP